MHFGGRHYDEWQFTTKSSRTPNFQLRKFVALLIFNPQKGSTFTPATLVTFTQAPHGDLTPYEHKQLTEQQKAPEAKRHPGLQTEATEEAKLLLEREAQLAQQRAAFLIIGSGGHDGDVHTARAVHLVDVDLVEHGLLGETEGVVAVAVELLGAQAAEVADTRQCLSLIHI